MDLHIYRRSCFLRGDSTMEIMRILKPSMEWWRICSWYMILSSTQWFLHVWTNWNIQPAFQDLRLFASFCVHKPNSSKISKLFRVQDAEFALRWRSRGFGELLSSYRRRTWKHPKGQSICWISDHKSTWGFLYLHVYKHEFPLLTLRLVWLPAVPLSARPLSTKLSA